MHWSARIGGVAVASLSLLLPSGCSDDPACASVANASMSCAAGVEYRGHFYMQLSDKLPATKGEMLDGAILPGCDDFGGGCDDETVDSGRPTKVWELRGVNPRVMVVGRDLGHGRLVVLARSDVEVTDYFRLRGGQWTQRRN